MSSIDPRPTLEYGRPRRRRLRPPSDHVGTLILVVLIWLYYGRHLWLPWLAGLVRLVAREHHRLMRLVFGDG